MLKETADHYKLRHTVVAGTELIATGVRGLDYLTVGKVYKAVHGMEEGIFESRPFVTVINDKGNVFSCHLSRFTIKEEER